MVFLFSREFMSVDLIFWASVTGIQLKRGLPLR